MRKTKKFLNVSMELQQSYFDYKYAYTPAIVRQPSDWIQNLRTRDEHPLSPSIAYDLSSPYQIGRTFVHYQFGFQNGGHLKSHTNRYFNVYTAVRRVVKRISNQTGVSRQPNRYDFIFAAIQSTTYPLNKIAALLIGSVLLATCAFHVVYIIIVILKLISLILLLS